MTKTGAAAVSFGLAAMACFAMAVAVSRPAHPATEGADLAMQAGVVVTLATQRGLDCSEGGLTEDLLAVGEVMKVRWPDAYKAGRVQGHQMIGALNKLPLPDRCQRYREILKD